ADQAGPAEALADAFAQLATSEVAVQIIHRGVGAISESDVIFAKASEAIVIGFNVRAHKQARDLAQQEGVDIRYYSVIYHLTDDLKSLMSGMLAPEIKEHSLGSLQIREVFSITKVGKVAGCMVTEGMVRRGNKVRLLRDDVVIHDGNLKTLRRFKDEAREVKEGYECGMAFENYQDIQVGDRIECYEIEEVARTL
ncbi:MAG: EF-Tu/IF-2/RF-3 family GTPase, partial [Kiloniellales bacterium]